jgi:hypothetical protein
MPAGSVGAMRDSSALLGAGDATGAALRAQLDADGYLLLRGALGRPAVAAARQQLLAARSVLAEDAPLVHDVLRRGPMQARSTRGTTAPPRRCCIPRDRPLGMHRATGPGTLAENL